MTLVLLGDGAPQVVARVPAGAARLENALRDLLFDHPSILPVGEIDPAIGPLVAVARELNVPGVGRIDALLADGNGQLVIVECKLWRNPQARREVVGQILDYARALARFSYDDLQREIASATGRRGNVLYELVRDRGGALDEARFVDQVSRNLAAGRFLLLVVGDGITEGTQRIGEYLQAQPGLAFDFALVEMAEYRFGDGTGERVIAQPRLLAKTAVIERAVIRNEAGSLTIADARDDAPGPSPRETGGRKIDPGFQQQWRDFAERLIAAVAFDDPAQPPPRVGGLGWLRVPLPGPAPLTLWRAKSDGVVGAFIRYRGSDGARLYAALRDDHAAIDREFAEAGLPAPQWQDEPDGGSLTVSWPSPWPWTEADEERQIDLLARAANRFVNSLRPRIDRFSTRAALA